MTVTEVYQCFIDQLQNSTVHSISLYEELTILYQKMKEVAVLTSDDDLSLKLDNAHVIIQEANSILEKTKYGSEGIGGVATKGCMFVGYPR